MANAIPAVAVLQNRFESSSSAGCGAEPPGERIELATIHVVFLPDNSTARTDTDLVHELFSVESSLT